MWNSTNFLRYLNHSFMSSNFLNFLLLAQQFLLLRMMLHWLLSKRLMIPGLWINNLWFVRRPTFWVWTRLWSCLRRKLVTTLRKTTSPNPWYKHSWMVRNNADDSLNAYLLCCYLFIYVYIHMRYHLAHISRDRSKSL